MPKLYYRSHMQNWETGEGETCSIVMAPVSNAQLTVRCSLDYLNI